MFEESFKNVPRKIFGCSKEVLRVLQWRKGCFNGVLSGFQGCLKKFNGLREKFQRCFRLFQGTFKCFKEDCGVVLDIFTGDSRELQGHPKEVQRVFQGSV